MDLRVAVVALAHFDGVRQTCDHAQRRVCAEHRHPPNSAEQERGGLPMALSLCVGPCRSRAGTGSLSWLQSHVHALETELVSKNSTIDQQARLVEEQGRAIKAFMQAETATEFITATERIAAEKAAAGQELESLKARIGTMPLKPSMEYFQVRIAVPCVKSVAFWAPL